MPPTARPLALSVAVTDTITGINFGKKRVYMVCSSRGIRVYYGRETSHQEAGRVAAAGWKRGVKLYPSLPGSRDVLPLATPKLLRICTQYLRLGAKCSHAGASQ